MRGVQRPDPQGRTAPAGYSRLVGLAGLALRGPVLGARLSLPAGQGRAARARVVQAAEESVKLLTDRDVQRHEHTRALRGQGHALVELGDLDAAAQKYQQSLALDPDDQMSRQELDYIKDLRAKRN